MIKGVIYLVSDIVKLYVVVNFRSPEKNNVVNCLQEVYIKVFCVFLQNIFVVVEVLISLSAQTN